MATSNDGFIDPGRSQGAIIGDHRMLSRFQVRVDGITPTLTAFESMTRGRCAFAYRAGAFGVRITWDLTSAEDESGNATGRLIHEIVIHNPTDEHLTPVLSVDVDADFINVLELRNPRSQRRSEVRRTASTAAATHFEDEGVGRRTNIGIDAKYLSATRNGSWDSAIPLGPGEANFRLCVVTYLQPGLLTHQNPELPPPLIATGVPMLDTWVTRSFEDIAELRLHNGSLAAGAPWFFTPFGRDTAIALLLMGSLAESTDVFGSLSILASHQGAKHDPNTNEEPGRIPHELRMINQPSVSLKVATANYFSIDATPLWLWAFAEFAQSGQLTEQNVKALVPHAERAAEWLTQKLHDGGGLVYYERSGDAGLVNQGWKDSLGAIVFGDGHTAGERLALIEVQCYTERALRIAAQVLHEKQEKLICAANALRHKINKGFIAEDNKGRFVGVAIDGDGSLVDSRTSNVAHGMWSRSFDPEIADLVSDQLSDPDLMTRFGLRTLDQRCPAYDIHSSTAYHCGPVWPHETAIAASGWANYGYNDLAAQAIDRLQHAVSVMPHGRLPEVLVPISDTHGEPARRSCLLQLWSAAAGVAAYRLICSDQLASS